jgi:hypothetical protein
LGSGPVIATRRIRSCLERLAGNKGNQKKKKDDHILFKIRVLSSEGTTETVTVLLDNGLKRPCRVRG